MGRDDRTVLRTTFLYLSNHPGTKLYPAGSGKRRGLKIRRTQAAYGKVMQVIVFRGFAEARARASVPD
jgi:hypothetical protein